MSEVKNNIDVTEILDKIYASEVNIHFGLAGDWDGGYYTIINAERIYLKADGSREAIIEMAGLIAEANPETDFAKWWQDILN